MRRLFRRLAPDLLVALLLLLLPLALFWPVTLGDRTLLPADNLFFTEPWASAAQQLTGQANPVPHNDLLSDLILENYPWKRFIVQSLRAGELPLWNPYLFAGVPFLAAGQHSALYPFSAIFWVVPLARAYGLFTWSQFFLAGLLAYVFGRVLGRSRPAAAFAGIAYQLCLFMVVSVVFPMIVAGAAWLPLVLTAIELVARQQPALGGRPATVPWVVLGAGALGLQILAGHIEITYYTLLVAAAYSAWRLLVLWNERRQARPAANGHAAGPTLWRRLLTRAGALLTLAGLGLALGAIQFVPLYELVQHNFRSGSATFDQIIGWAYPWRHALAFLIPNVFGNPSHHGYWDIFTGQWVPATTNALGQATNTIFWGVKNYVEGGAYVGVLPLLLAVVAVAAPFSTRRRVRSQAGRRRGGRLPDPLAAVQPLVPGRPRAIVPFFAGLALLSLAFAFPTRLYAIIFWLPGINQLHSPFRWVWVFSLSVAVLAAYGFDALRPVKGEAPRQRKAGAGLSRLFYLGAAPSLAMALAAIAVWGGLALLAALAAAWLGYERLGVDRLMQFLLDDLALANTAFADGRMFFAYEARWAAQFAAVLAASGLVLRLSRWPRRWRGVPVWQLAALGVAAADLLAAGWGFNAAADPAILNYTPPSVAFLKQDDSLWRFTSYDPHGDKPFNANQGWYFDLYDVRGYDSIFTRQYVDFMGLIQHQYELDFNRIAPLSVPEALDSPLLDLLNVKYVISEVPIDNPKYTLVYEGEVRIYRNETALPRAYTQPVAATLAVDDFAQAVQANDPRTYVITEDDRLASLAPEPTATWPGPVEAIDYAPSEVYVTAAVEAPSWLVLADSFFPGWRAYVRPAGAGESEEQRVDIHLVNGNFRGVLLEPGHWTVRFKYSPDSVKVGGIVSFVAGMALVLLLGLYAWRYFYRESALDSTARRVAKNSLAPMALHLTNRFVELAYAAFYLRVLGPDDAGKFYLAIVIFGWFEIFTNYGLNTLLTRDAARDRASANRYLVNTTILRLALGLVAIPALALILGAFQVVPSFTLPFGLGAFHPNRLTPDTLWAIALLVIAQAPATVATGLSALFYAYEKAEYPAAVTTVTTLAKVSLGTVALVLGWGFVGLAGVSIIVNAITLGILGTLAWRLFFRPRWEFDLGYQQHAVRESFPLMLNNLLATLFYKVDVTLLQPIRGPTEVGWYSTGYKFVDAYNVIPSLFTFALFPVMSRQAIDDRPGLARSYALAVKLLVAVALPLAVVTTALARLMVSVLGGAEYLPFGAIALAVLVWSIPFGWINSVTNYLLIALNQQRSLTRAFGVSLLFNVAVNLALLPAFGYVAAAATTIASEIFEGAAFYWYLRRSLGPVPWLRLLWRLWLSAGVMAALVAGLWALSPVLALAAGLAAYAALVVGLRAFSPDERALLSGILPEKLRFRPRVAVITSDE